MIGYLFIFGRTPALSELELATFFPNRTLPGSTVAFVEQQLKPEELIRLLGGTVKIAQVLGHVSSISAQILAPFIDGRIFGVSIYPEGKMSRQSLEEIKRLVPGSRFVEAREASALSSVVIEKQRVFDLVVVKDARGYVVGKTVAVQPFEGWSRRDRGRPFADPKSGMLPPKVARMVVNIAGIGKGKTLLDPFCGMGTILAEAMIMGWQVVGSDQLGGVVEKAAANLNWLKLKNYQLFVSDATHISERVNPASIDAIVTEPFLGKQTNRISEHDTKNILRGLEKLYIGCLKDWKKVLKPKAKVIMAFPEYHVGSKTYFVKKVIDTAEPSGYTTLAGPIEYSRPQALVRREFYIFQKT